MTQTRRRTEPLVRSGIVVFLLAGLIPLAPGAGAGPWEAEESRTLRETLSFTGSAAERLLVVDNISGSIRVSGHDREEVLLVAKETLYARSREHLEQARKEAGLRIDEAGEVIELIVDGPFRREDGSLSFRRRPHYEFHYEFEIRLPRRTHLELRNINGGAIAVRGVEGALDVANVNGAVELSEVAGHGRIRTVNGGIEASFLRSPQEECRFLTVNGDLDIAFPGDFAAELRFKTMNGDAYTDFDYTPRILPASGPRKRGGTTVWKSLGHGASVGAGGPEISFETLNGDIYIRNTQL